MPYVPTILLVGGESSTRFTIAGRLRECGFDVIHTGGFQEAMALLGSRAVVVDLVLSDADLMDERDGLELARWARAACPGLPVILTAGAAQTADLCDQLRGLGPIETALHRAAPPAPGPDAAPDANAISMVIVSA